MGLYAEFSIDRDWGFDHQLQASIEGYPEFGEIIVNLDYSPACEVFINTFMDLALSFVPVDTGFLESTIEAGGDGDTCWAEAWADYAQYVEYGTSIMSAQPFFEDALETACSDAFFVASAIYRRGWEQIENWVEMTKDEIEAREEEEEEAEGDEESDGEEGEEDEGPEEEDSGGSSKDYTGASIIVLLLLAIVQTILEMLFGFGESKGQGIPAEARASVPEVIIT